jgi:hypothetical protein
MNRKRFVCTGCFDNEGVQAFVTANSVENECDFCGAKSNEPIAADIDEVGACIARGIAEYYDDPANTLPYESAEGGYQGVTYSMDEVFHALDLDFPNDEDDSLRDAISSRLDTDLWSDAEPFALTPDEQLSMSWEQFCEVIKHERRYFFLSKQKRKDSELYSPAEVLKTIFEYAETMEAFIPLPEGSRVFRARRQPDGKSYTTAGDLGPPPLNRAIQTNRMSPPGIVMTYVSDDQETALAETANEPGTFAVGEFITEREALILDLTQLPPIPSVFRELSDSLEYDPRRLLRFLHHISQDISRPIERDELLHIEYVPTQVVTEYIRTAITIEGRSIDGIRYRSARRHTHTALVLFADRDNLILEKAEQPALYHFNQDCWLRLNKATVMTVAQNDIDRWAMPVRGWWG